MLILLFFNCILLISAIVYILIIQGKHSQITLYDFDLEYTKKLKGIAALLIVLCHFSIFSGGDMPMSGRLAATGLPLTTVFFFISGYGLLNSYLKNGRKSIESFFTRRFLKVLIPLLVVNLLKFCIDFFAGTDFPSWYELWQSLIYSSPYLWFSWFVYALFFLYVIYYAFFRFIDNPYIATWGISITIVLFVLLSTELNVFSFWRTTVLTFVIGLIYRLFEEKIKMKMIGSLSFFRFVYIFILLVNVGLLVYMKFYSVPEDPELLVGYIIVNTATLPIIMTSYIFRNKNRITGIVTKIGGISYEIYLLHGIIIEYYFLQSFSLFVQFVCFYIIIVLAAYFVNIFDGFLYKKISSIFSVR